MGSVHARVKLILSKKTMKYFMNLVLLVTVLWLLDEGSTKLVNKVRHKKKGGTRAKAGGGGKGGKGGNSGGPAWLNRKPWETELWKEFTTPASTTTDADYGDTTIASNFEVEAKKASPLYGVVPQKPKRSDDGEKEEDEETGSMEEQDKRPFTHFSAALRATRKEFINAATGLKCNAETSRFKYKCKAVNKILGRDCTTVFYNLDATSLSGGDEVCCKAWGCFDLRGGCEDLGWQDIGCVKGGRGGEMEHQVGWGKVKQRPRLRCNITPKAGVVSWGYRAIHNDYC